jgi:ppGpp synthetase/RelA/SpoT-type nucleotidyltranferase
MAMEGHEPVISNFISAYHMQYDFYFAVARLASSLCEEAMEQNGIRAITTFRAKRPDRLETKLRQRQKQRREEGRDVYTEEVQIRADIVDLAGVRIALYFPDDRIKVEKVINETFKVNRKKPMQGKKETIGGFDQRFDGYGADHYRVHFETRTLKRDQQHYGPAPIEIQVASLLMHAWSEVNHDLGYKPIEGAASHDELRILDGLNGLVLTGELLLQQLQAAAKSRISSENRKFENQYELGAFLQNHISRATSKTALMGRLDILFDVLKAMDINSPRALVPEFEKWNVRKTIDSSVAISLMDHTFWTFDTAQGAYVANNSLLSRGIRDADQDSLDSGYGLKRRILLNATIAYDGLHKQGSKGKSLRSLRDSNPGMLRFHQLYSVVERTDNIGNTDFSHAVDKLWKWFNSNPDIRARAALGIAVLDEQHIIDRLKSSSGAEEEEEEGEEGKRKAERRLDPEEPKERRRKSDRRRVQSGPMKHNLAN